MRSADAAGNRFEDLIRRWRVAADSARETETSWLAFGNRGGLPVVLKVLKHEGQEWRAGEILEAFEGRGMARVYERSSGAVLLERLSPGRPLAELALAGQDDEATAILAGVVARMRPRSVPECPTPYDWGAAFARYETSGDAQIPAALAAAARETWARLFASQSGVRLLHGDLHHGNVLLDAQRGWLAIDPKGVVAEVEFELGAALRNPWERPDLFARPAIIARRVKRFASTLAIDQERTLAWAFAQAVLAAIWCVEDGVAVRASVPLALAQAVATMLERP